MNISAIKNTAVQTNFGCNDPKCNHYQASFAPQTKPDIVDITTNPQKQKEAVDKVKTAIKKTMDWTKENKNPLKAGLWCAAKGAAVGLAVVGAQTVVNRILPVSANIKNSFANKLAVLATLAVGVGTAFQNREAFKKEPNKAKQ